MVSTTLCASAWIAGLAPLSLWPDILGGDDSAAYLSHAGSMQLEEVPGNVEVTDFGFHTLMANGISLAENLTLDAAFDWRGTILRFHQVPTSIPIDRKHLESFSVFPSVVEASALLVAARADSRWMWGAWASSGLATDFREIGSDDFSLSIAGCGGYRLHDRLTVGVGAALTRLTGDVEFQPGFGLDWQVSDRIRMSVCGPNFAAAYMPGANWQFSMEGGTTSETWNVLDDAGESLDLELTSFRIGMHASYRITDRISINAGSGVTYSNKIGLNRPNGDVILKQRLDSGFYGQIGLTIRSW